MVCNEVRKDYLLNRWVVIATERSRRPIDFIKVNRLTLKEKSCPLCVGNKALTPPTVFLYLTDNGKKVKSVDTPKEREQNLDY